MKTLLFLFITFSLLFKGNAKAIQADITYLLPQKLPSMDKICRLEIKNCHKIGKPVNQRALFLIEKNKDWILYLGQKYGVQPNLIASIFLAEQSLSFDLYDVAKSILASYIEVNSSLGPLQITSLAAQEAEKLLSKIDNRAILSKEVFREKALDLKSALYYATGYLLHIQNAYKKNNLNISNHLGLMGTLYTLGSPHKRAKRTIKLNKPIRISYYGYFIEMNKETINKILYPQKTINNLTQQYASQY